MTLEDKLRVSFLIGTIRGTRRSMTEYYRQVKAAEPITGKILEKCISDLGSAERRLCNLVETTTTEHSDLDVHIEAELAEAPIFRSVKDEDEGKEK